MPVLTALLLVVSAFAVPLQEHDLDAALRLNIRTAVGYDAFERIERGVSFSGKAKFLGVDSDFSFLFTQKGEFVEQITGRLTMSQGFDGKTTWLSDWHGVVRILEMEDEDSAHLFAAVMTHSWLSDRSRVAKLSAKRQGGEFVIPLRLPDSPAVAEIFVDAETYLPKRYVRETPAGDEVIEFKEYREFRGVKFPVAVTQTEGGVVNTYSITTIEPLPMFIRNPFEVPVASGARAAFDPAKPPSVQSRRAITGHTMVRASLDGGEEKWFILDSGAGITVLDKKLADDMKLDAFGELPVLGIGGLVKAQFRPLNTITVGPVALKEINAISIDLGMLRTVFGSEFGGIIGYDLLAHAVVEYDHATPSVAIHDPKRYTLGGGKWLRLRFNSKLPCVEAAFEGGFKDVFRLDTGAPNNVTFHAPAVRKYRLLEGRKTTDTMLGGVGGMIQAKAGKIKYFEVGGKRIEEPTVTFATSDDSAFGDPYLAGNLGTAFLDRFTVVFDYVNQRVAFVDKPSN
ncbi:MAG: hypothetical protein C4341_02150 [Armatimonadota bacterium]